MSDEHVKTEMRFQTKQRDGVKIYKKVADTQLSLQTPVDFSHNMKNYQYQTEEPTGKKFLLNVQTP